MQLQRTVGNRAAAGLLASRAEQVAQRKVVWGKNNHPDDTLDGFMKKLDDLVQEGAQIALYIPDALPQVDKYTTQWQNTAALIHGMNTKSIQPDDDQLETIKTAFHFGPARYGYAIESYASKTKFNAMKSALPEGYDVATQIGHGSTRPDIIVFHQGSEVGWFDITSSASTGHIYGKVGGGWTGKSYVAEVTYPPLIPHDVGTGSMSTADIEQMKAAFEKEQQQWNSFLQGRIDTFNAKVDQIANEMFQAKGGGLSQAEYAQATKKALCQTLGYDYITDKPASALLRSFGLLPAKYCIDGHGTKADGNRMLREYLDKNQ